jgi:response regulator of citrate/malate metabolism
VACCIPLLQDPLLFYRLKQHFKAAAAAAAAADQEAYMLQQHLDMVHKHEHQQQQQQQQQQQRYSLAAMLEHEAAQGLSSSSSSSEAHVVEDFLRRYAAYGFDGKADAAECVVSNCGARSAAFWASYAHHTYILHGSAVLGPFWPAVHI